MRTVHISEAANLFPALLAAAEAGEEVALTRYGEVVARLLPGTLRSATRRCRSEAGMVLDSPLGMCADLLSPLD